MTEFPPYSKIDSFNPDLKREMAEAHMHDLQWMAKRGSRMEGRIDTCDHLLKNYRDVLTDEQIEELKRTRLMAELRA